MSNDREGTPPLFQPRTVSEVEATWKAIAARQVESVNGLARVALDCAGAALGSVPESRLRAADAAGARADREAGIRWQADARAYVLSYGAIRETFMAEDVKARWDEAKLPAAPDGRAFGAVFAFLSRRGSIFKCGYRLDKFGSPKPIWRLGS